MNDQNITCPKCGKDFPLSSTLTSQLNEHIKQEYEMRFEKEKKEFLEKEKLEMWNKAQQKAKEKLEMQLKDLQTENEEREKMLAEFEKRELDLRKEKRLLEENERKMRLEIARQKDEARKEAVLQIRKEVDEELRLKLAEKDKQMEQLTRTIQDLKRQSEQGSMQIQGDAAETDLKLVLQNNFITDEIVDVPTGIRGADLVQTIKSNFGTKMGVILWECKNTKGFNQEWIKKLKDDQIPAKADVCILVTKTLPEGMNSFGLIDDVWVVESSYVIPLTNAIRHQIVQITQLKQSMVGSEKKMEYLYNYLLSSEFKNKIENIIRAFTVLKMDLDVEKRAMQKIWSKREKELERVVSNTSSLYGDLQGATDNQLPKISSLELESGNEEIAITNKDEAVELF